MAGIEDHLSDAEIEQIGVEQLDVVLQSDVKVCKVCKVGDVVTQSTGEKKLGNGMLVYTRDGTFAVKHLEKRCNNRSLPCRAGHYYGYVSMGAKRC